MGKQDLSEMTRGQNGWSLHLVLGQVNQTFSNQTHSNSNRLIDLGWVLESNIIELTQNIGESNTIKCLEIKHFNNRT